MSIEDIRRRLAELDLDQPLPDPDPEPTAAELKEHFRAMQREVNTPAHIERVYRHHCAEELKAERRYRQYLKEISRHGEKEK